MSVTKKRSVIDSWAYYGNLWCFAAPAGTVRLLHTAREDSIVLPTKVELELFVETVGAAYHARPWCFALVLVKYRQPGYLGALGIPLGLASVSDISTAVSSLHEYYEDMGALVWGTTGIAVEEATNNRVTWENPHGERVKMNYQDMLYVCGWGRAPEDVRIQFSVTFDIMAG